MTEIPEDVMKAAGDAILNGGCALKIGDVMHVSISRAILAERGRCAKVAERYSDGIYASMAIMGDFPS